MDLTPNLVTLSHQARTRQSSGTPIPLKDHHLELCDTILVNLAPAAVIGRAELAQLVHLMAQKIDGPRLEFLGRLHPAMKLTETVELI